MTYYLWIIELYSIIARLVKTMKTKINYRQLRHDLVKVINGVIKKL